MKMKISNRKKVDASVAMEKLHSVLVNAILSRSTIHGMIDGTGLDGANRNLARDCGYIEGTPTLNQYRLMYDTEGVATRIINVYPQECWSVWPEVYETERNRNTRFERYLKEVLRAVPLWSHLARLDEISGIGYYGIGVLGIDDNRGLDQPVATMNEFGAVKKPNRDKPSRKLLYMQTYSHDLVRIDTVEMNPANPRYGMPKTYKVKITDPSSFNAETSSYTVSQEITVHWHRVIHFADGCKSSSIYGTPRLQNLHNRVFDVRKILGSSGEMFYKGGFFGLSFETDPSLVDGLDVDMDSLKAEIEAYSNGLQRYMRLVGMSAKSLQSQVSDPQNHLLAQYAYIAATLSIPLPVFMGDTAGNLSSENNDKNWKRQVGRRRNQVVTPFLIDPTIQRLIDVDVLPEPTVEGSWIAFWPDFTILNEADKATTALKVAQAILQYVTSGSSKLIRPKQFFVLVLRMSEAEADAIIEAAGGEDQILEALEELYQAGAGINQDETTDTDPTAKTGKNGSKNGLGSSKKKGK